MVCRTWRDLFIEVQPTTLQTPTRSPECVSMDVMNWKLQTNTQTEL
jgi:hypothetical protein